MAWLRRNWRWLSLIATAAASAPFLPEWVRDIAASGSQALGTLVGT